MQYLSNPDLKTIKTGYKGNPIRDNRFVNYEDVPLPTFGKVLKWRFSKNPQREEKKRDSWLPEVRQQPGIFADRNPKLVWLGHASFLLTLNGKQLLIDPVWGDIPFVKRLVGLPFHPDNAIGIDYLLLSHGHFDHCDKKTIRSLASLNPAMKVFAPLKMNQVLLPMNRNISVQEAGWYQSFNLGDEQIRITYMPAFHWYKRGLNDNNEILWGSFIIEWNGTTIFFMGDSGYNTHFSEIASFFPEIDYAIMGVGAYQPAYMMKTSHTSPDDAVKAFNDLKAKVFIPMHYGTYDLADEPIGEPLRRLKQLKAEGKINGELLMPAIGEVLPLR